MRKKHVAVLMGGLSVEREVSLASGAGCANALRKLGYRVTEVDVDYNISQILQELKPDVVLNMLHGEFGEDGTIQGVLEYLSIPYSHSGVLASAVAMNKELAKIIVAKQGVVVAPSVCVDRSAFAVGDPMPRPYVVKPVDGGGSSFGVLVVKDDNYNVKDIILDENWNFGNKLLVEKYIAGRELTCAVMGDKVLGVCEIEGINGAFYDYEAKYSKNASKHTIPAKILPDIYQKVSTMSLNAHNAIGCRGISRSDFRYDEDSGEVVWLELNSQPGMTETSLVPDIARNAGIEFAELVEWMVEDASCKR